MSDILHSADKSMTQHTEELSMQPICNLKRHILIINALHEGLGLTACLNKVCFWYGGVLAIAIHHRRC